MSGGPRRAAAHARATAERAGRGFIDDGATQSAAAISYYALLSLFPLAILMVAAFSLVLDDGVARERVIDLVLENLPLREQQGRRDLEEALTSVTQEARGFGITGVAGLLVAGSGVMGAVRKALNTAWGVEDGRPLAQAKAVDVLLVLALGSIVIVSLTLTMAARLTGELSAELEQALGPVGSAAPRLALALGPVVPALVAFGAFAVLFSTVPARDTRLRDTWPGAATAAAGFEAAKACFAVYLDSFASYAAVYAGLATVIAVLVFVFVTANVVLFGAHVAVAWPAARAPRAPAPGTPFGARVRSVVRGLFVRRDASG